MKIEVGESLMRSWLRHVKGCQFAELNWKPSASWATYHEPQEFMDGARAYFQQSLGSDVFEGTKNASQLIKQGDIDVLGIKIDVKGATERLYGIEIAFHEGGLNYGGSDETTKRIMKKLLRMIMVVRTYCGPVRSEFVFASPKVGQPFLNPLQAGIEQLEQFLMNQGIDYKVHLLVNQAFRKQVLAETLKNSSGTADSSELFLRSHRLLRLFESDSDVSQVFTHNVFEPRKFDDMRDNPKATALPIQFDPADTEEFKDRLLSCRKAHIIIEYENGTTKRHAWIADKFSKESNLLGNLRSRPEFRHGEWQKRGIARVKVVIDDSLSPIN